MKVIGTKKSCKEKLRADEEGEETATQSLLDTDISNEGECDMNFGTPKTSKRCHHRSSHTGASSFIPHDILKCPRLVALAASLNISAAQKTFTAALIADSQGNSSNVSTSYATADRSRRNVVQQFFGT